MVFSASLPRVLAATPTRRGSYLGTRLAANEGGAEERAGAIEKAGVVDAVQDAWLASDSGCRPDSGAVAQVRDSEYVQNSAPLSALVLPSRADCSSSASPSEVMKAAYFYFLPDHHHRPVCVDRC